ncbi:MAG TPA: M56 family metallopeptidase, partial [Longimicrobium sp.]|nr:M56 family metallopeptidase [Longimicrobium sp.]
MNPLDTMTMDGALPPLADLAVKGAVILAAAACAAWMLRRASASARHLAWAMGFAGMLALPLLGALLPAWRVPVLPAADAASPASAVALDAPAAADRAAPAPAISIAPDAPPVDAPHGPGLAAILLLVWAAGAAVALGRLAASVARVRREGRIALPVRTGPAAALLARLARRMGVSRPIELLEGDVDAMPLTWGILRPRILLPRGTEAWPDGRLEAVLLHELAHVRRRDCLAQVAAEAACVLHWFNPLAWAALRRLKLESEHACDDQVLLAGAPGCDYADHLLDVARALRPARHMAVAAVAMARPTQLRTRLQAVLSADRRRGPVPRRLAVPALLVAALGVAGVAALTPDSAIGAQPGLVPPAECPATGSLQHLDEVTGGVWRVSWSNGRGCAGEARIHEGVRFGAGGIASVERGG